MDDRRVLNGIFWVLRSGAPWWDLPEIYGPCTTCYNRKHLKVFEAGGQAAWVEQKNGAVVRRLVGYGRFEGMARL